MSTRIFISYRRTDSRADARSIHQWLQSRFGKDALFIDVDAIRKGRNFVDVLHGALSETAVLICLIGPHWLDARDEAGNRRIDNADDYVRLEITTALKRGIPIIPIRVEAQALPSEAELPDELKPLAKRMAAIVSHESFAQDMEALEQELNEILRPARYVDRLRQRLQMHKRWVVLCATCLLLTALASRGEILSFADRVAATATALRHGTSLHIAQDDADGAMARMQEAKLKLSDEAQRELAEENKADGLDWAWALAQIMSAAPDATTGLRSRYLAYLDRKLDPECLCFLIDGIPNAVASAWVLISADQRREPVHDGVLRGLLRAQDSKGWWSIAMDATPADANASLYVTSLVVMALVSYRDTLAPTAPERAPISSAVERAADWLTLRAPRSGQGWRDYPANEERSTSNPMFGAMVITAIAAARPDRVSHEIVAKAVDTRAKLAEPTLYFSSDVYVARKHDKRYIDKYRHVPFPWQVSGLVAAYPYLGLEERGRILVRLKEALKVDFRHDTFKRQEWLLAEEMFLLRRALAATAAVERSGKAGTP